MRAIFIVALLSIGLVACEEKQAQPTTPTSSLAGVTLPSFAVIEMSPEPSVIASSDPRLPIEPAAGGQALYERHCASCHGINGEGQYPDNPYGVDAQGLVGAPPHDDSGHTWHHPDQVLIDIVYHGQMLPNFYPMPAFREQLSLDEIIDILAYIKLWWGDDEQAHQRDVTESYQP